jgi:hypothetical protein
MKPRQIGFGLVGIVGLVIAFEIGLHLQTPPPSPNPNNRLITISASPLPDTGKCEVDFPVAVLRYSQNHSVQWASNDNKYWVSFLTIDSPAGYTPENPLAPPDEPVVIEPHGQSKTYHVKPKAKYYMYAIFDHDPQTNNKNPCKTATDDHDTGLNIKQ